MSTTFNNIGFGEYPNYTLPWVLFNRPNLFYWGIQKRVWVKHQHLKDQAEVLDYRSRHILVPNNVGGELQVYYLVPRKKKALRKVLVLPQGEEPPVNSLIFPFDVGLISDVFDLSYPYTLAPNENHHGPRSIIQAITNSYYGIPSRVWDEDLCQQFFYEDRNFKP